MRVEDERVFDDVHRLVLGLVRAGRVDGLRIDHVDGLADPAAYLKRLRRETGDETYIVVEKILEAGETLPADWPVQGTTGYEFIATLAGVLVDAKGARKLDAAYRQNGGSADPETEQRNIKRRMATHNFAGELDALTRLACRTAGAAEGAPSTEDGGAGRRSPS